MSPGLTVPVAGPFPSPRSRDSGQSTDFLRFLVTDLVLLVSLPPSPSSLFVVAASLQCPSVTRSSRLGAPVEVLDSGRSSSVLRLSGTSSEDISGSLRTRVPCLRWGPLLPRLVVLCPKGVLGTLSSMVEWTRKGLSLVYPRAPIPPPPAPTLGVSTTVTSGGQGVGRRGRVDVFIRTELVVCSSPVGVSTLL